MSPVEERLRKLIAAGGTVTVARFMEEALSQSEHAYYRDRDPIGAGGDFVTAPEVSQMFGELIGLWAVSCWRQMGAPAAVRLVELGPGRGTLLADALRAAELAPEFLRAIEIHLVEINTALRARQAEALGDHPASWHDSLDGVPEGPLLLIANEFLDALPVHQLQYTTNGWRERAVALDADTDQFAWGERPAPDHLISELDSESGAEADAIYELGPARNAIALAAAERLVQHGGAALFIDYGHGHEIAAGDTLQAVRRHAYHDPLEEPGTADLTAHVAFGALRKAAGGAGARVWGPVSQGHFLTRLGLSARADALKRSATLSQAEVIDAALHRLIHPGEMGTLFRAMAITATDMPAPAGFEETRSS